jgi:hypothetical protein
MPLLDRRHERHIWRDGDLRGGLPGSGLSLVIHHRQALLIARSRSLSYHGRLAALCLHRRYVCAPSHRCRLTLRNPARLGAALVAGRTLLSTADPCYADALAAVCFWRRRWRRNSAARAADADAGQGAEKPSTFAPGADGQRPSLQQLPSAASTMTTTFHNQRRGKNHSDHHAEDADINDITDRAKSSKSHAQQTVPHVRAGVQSLRKQATFKTSVRTQTTKRGVGPLSTTAVATLSPVRLKGATSRRSYSARMCAILVQSCSSVQAPRAAQSRSMPLPCDVRSPRSSFNSAAHCWLPCMDATAVANLGVSAAAHQLGPAESPSTYLGLTVGLTQQRRARLISAFAGASPALA